jgi:hypothetical protein
MNYLPVSGTHPNVCLIEDSMRRALRARVTGPKSYIMTIMSDSLGFASYFLSYHSCCGSTSP